MGKMPGTDEGEGRRVWRSVEHTLKTMELLVRQDVKKGLEKHYSFTEAGVQVVVDGVQKIPVLIRMERVARCQFFRSG